MLVYQMYFVILHDSSVSLFFVSQKYIYIYRNEFGAVGNPFQMRFLNPHPECHMLRFASVFYSEQNVRQRDECPTLLAATW